jgi:hypothetical protein
MFSLLSLESLRVDLSMRATLVMLLFLWRRKTSTGNRTSLMSFSQIWRHSRESGNPFCFAPLRTDQDGFPLSRE